MSENRPAFPVTITDNSGQIAPKGMAMQGLLGLANSESYRSRGLSADQKIEAMAKEAGVVADALLAEDAEHEARGK